MSSYGVTVGFPELSYNAYERFLGIELSRRHSHVHDIGKRGIDGIALIFRVQASDGEQAKARQITARIFTSNAPDIESVQEISSDDF